MPGSQHKTAQSIAQFICMSSAAAGARPTACSLSAVDTNVHTIRSLASHAALCGPLLSSTI